MVFQVVMFDVCKFLNCVLGDLLTDVAGDHV